MKKSLFFSIMSILFVMNCYGCPLPSAGTITGPSKVCVAASISLSDATSGGIWSTSNTNATLGGGGVVIGGTAGMDTIIYTVTDACGSSQATYVVTINPLPDSGIIRGPATVCPGGTITLSDSIPGGTWLCANANARISVTGKVTGIISGNDTVYYKVTNTCGSTAAPWPITIGGPPSPAAISGAHTVCLTRYTTLSSAVSGGSWGNLTGKTTITSAGGVVYGYSVGVDSIYYTVNNACGSATSRFPITVLIGGSCGSLQAASVSAIEQLQVYPNPNNGTFVINYTSDRDEQVRITVTNIVGKVVEDMTIPSNKAIDVKINQPAGVYLLSAVTAEKRQLIKLILQ